MIVANVDGGARGNPGPAGYGAFIADDQGNVLAELYEGIGISTNNVAEYRGLSPRCSGPPITATPACTSRPTHS